MSNPASKWEVATRRSTLAIWAASLLLLAYIGFLMTSNYRSQMALHESSLKRFHLDLEKRVASLGYFFSERKYDLASMAASREVSSYFINESLGMSEQYGLKISYFLMEEMLKKAISDKSIGGDRIYQRFAFVDRSGHVLVDTDRNGALDRSPTLWPEPPTIDQGEPTIHIDQADDGAHILMAAPCFYKDEFAGTLIAWLNQSTLLSYFVGFSRQLSHKQFYLIVSNGKPICPSDVDDCPFADHLDGGTLALIPQDRFSSFTFFSDAIGHQKMLGTRLPIDNTPLCLVAGASIEVILGSFEPWQLLTGMGLLALMIVVGIGFLIRSNTRNMVLKARFDESESQHGLLTSKNLQLENEISRRLKAERELEHRVKERTAELTEANRAIRESEGQLRILSSRLLSAQEEERKRIAHELHDSIGGALSAIKFGMENALEKMHEGEATPDALVALVATTQYAIEEARRIYMDLRPSMLDDLGLLATIGWFTRQFRTHYPGVELEVCLELEEGEIPRELRVILFRVLQEAFHNVAKHSGAYVVEFSLTNEEGRITLTVSDNGTGFTPGDLSASEPGGRGIGLDSMQERVESSGGILRVRSAKGMGTTIQATWDLDRLQ